MPNQILRNFDPWKSPLCTCPPKLSLNPYTGCAHGCLYCYASSYIPRFQECRPKEGLLKRLARELARAEPDKIVSLSNSSDPYPPMEEGLKLTRGCLRLLKDYGRSAQVVTKSDIVKRDIDILKEMPSAVSITITTLSDDLSRKLEINAPLPKRRLNAIRALRGEGIPVSVRLDPIIPGINDSEIEELVSAVAQAGALHVTSSTYKARPDSWKRMCRAFPEEMVALGQLFEQGSRTGGSRYLPVQMRKKLMAAVCKASTCESLTFSCCREDLAFGGTASCDGTHLLVDANKSENSVLQ
ncbi:MAG: radical SAM protein [Methanotrichaceae archaeon]|nr:radical SAM protein [Methanotrichaceae archaeon]